MKGRSGKTPFGIPRWGETYRHRTVGVVYVLDVDPRPFRSFPSLEWLWNVHVVGPDGPRVVPWGEYSTEDWVGVHGSTFTFPLKNYGSSDGTDPTDPTSPQTGSCP